MSQSIPDTTMVPLLFRTAVLAVFISIVYLLWNKWRSQGRAKSTKSTKSTTTTTKSTTTTTKSTKSTKSTQPYEELLHYVATKSDFQTLLDQDKLGEIEMQWREFVKPPTTDDHGQTRAFGSDDEQQEFLNHTPDVIGPPSFFKQKKRMNVPWRNEMEFIVYDKHAVDGKKFIVVHSHFVGEDVEGEPESPPTSYTNLWPSLGDDPFREDMMVWQVNIRHTLEVEARCKATVIVKNCDDGWESINGVRNFFIKFNVFLLHMFTCSHAHMLTTCSQHALCMFSVFFLPPPSIFLFKNNT